MNGPDKIQRVKALANELHELFPDKNSVELSINSFDTEIGISLTLHGHKTYASATNEMQSLGVGVRQKTPYCEGMIYTRLEGKTDGVTVRTYPDELPPSCHIEKVVEKIPKKQTVDTGEFIEIERNRVVCSGGSEVAAAIIEAHPMSEYQKGE